MMTNGCDSLYEHPLVLPKNLEDSLYINGIRYSTGSTLPEETPFLNFNYDPNIWQTTVRDPNWIERNILRLKKVQKYDQKQNIMWFLRKECRFTKPELA